MNFQMVKMVLEKAKEAEIKSPTSVGSLQKQESSRKTSTSVLLTIPNPLLEGLMLKLKLQYFGHLMRRFDSLELNSFHMFAK